MAKKKAQATTKKAKPAKKVNTGLGKPKPLVQPQGKVFGDQDRVRDLLTQVNSIAKRVELAVFAERQIHYIERHSMLLGDKDREFWLENRKEIWEIWRTAREAIIANSPPPDANESQTSAGEQSDSRRD